MSSRGLRCPSPALVISFLALFVALSGTALALQANSVRSQHMVNGQVRTRDLHNGAVKTRAQARDAVTAEKLAAGAVTTAKLAPGGVGSAHVVDGSLTGAHFAGGSIGAADLASGSVGPAQVAGNAANGSKVAAGSLSGADVATGSIAQADLATGSVDSAKVLALVGDDVNDATLGSPLVRNVTVHTSSTATNTTSTKFHGTQCPAGKKPIGGGALVTGTTSHTNYAIQVSMNNPAAGVDGWLGGARRMDTPVEAWALTVRVICANI
jgi:hypothetical protein